MARINISVTDELKLRMDALSVNWSQVAQEAFAVAVEIAELKGKSMNKEAGIARLRANKATKHDLLRAQAHAAGAEWAIETAEYDQLARVAKLAESVAAMAESIGGEWLAPGAMHFLAEAINEHFDAEAIAKELFGTDSPTDAQVEAFIEGAAEVFEEV